MKKKLYSLGRRVRGIHIRFFNCSMTVNHRKGEKVRLRSGRKSSATEKKGPCDRTAVILLSIRRESLRGINQRLL